MIAQIGAVRLGLGNDFPILDTFRSYVVPVDRHGQRYALDPFFTRLTGITERNIDEDGVSLADALGELDAFSKGRDCRRGARTN